MCSTPKMPQVKNIVPQAPQQVEAPPDPVKIDKEGGDAIKRRRNPLRIDLASSPSSAPSSGVNV